MHAAVAGRVDELMHTLCAAFACSKWESHAVRTSFRVFEHMFEHMF